MSAWQGLRVKVRGGELARLGPFTVAGRKPVVRRNARGEVTSRSYMVDVRLPDGRTWAVPEADVTYVDGTPPSREEQGGRTMTATKQTAKAPAKATPAKKAAAKKAPAKATTKKAPAKATAKKAPAKVTENGSGPGTGHGAVSAEDRAKRDATIVKMRADGEGNAAIAAATGMSVTGVRNAVIRLNA